MTQRWVLRAAGILAASLTACVFANTSRAQEVISPSNSTKDTKAAARSPEEQVLVLPDFYVNSRTDNSYLATESTSGTRVARDIIDLPYTIQVITPEFIKDFQLYDLDLVAPFVSGMARGEPATGGGGGTRLRGLFVPTFRNGFARTQAPDANNIERVEVVRGPQSAIYGRVAPGGVVNFISKKPLTRPQYGLTYTAGSYDYDMYTGYATGPLVKDKLYYRFDGAYYTQHRPTDFWFNRTTNLSGSLTYKPTKVTTVSLEMESTKRIMNDGVIFTRWINSAGVTQGSVIDMPDRAVAERLLSTNAYLSAYSKAKRINDSLYGTVEHKFADDLVLRVNGTFTKRRFSRFGPTNPGVWDTRTSNWQSTRQMNNLWIKYLERGSQVDLSKTWKTSAPQRTLLTFDVYASDQKQKSASLSGTALTNALNSLGYTTTAAQSAWLRPDPFHPETSGYLSIPSYDPLTYVMQNASTFNLYQLYRGGLLNHTVDLMDRRLSLTGSVRSDWVNIKRQQPLSSDPDLQEAISSQRRTTFSTGANYHILPSALVAYVSYGSGFNPSPQVDQNTGRILGNTTSKGVDAGLKGVILNNRLSYTLAVYRIDQDNQAVTNPANPTGSILDQPALLPGGGTKGRGASIDLAGSLTPNLSLLGNIAWTDVRVSKNLANPSQVGLRPVGTQNVPPRTASLALRYSFNKGGLKGFSTGLTYQYESTWERLAETKNAAGAVTSASYWLKARNEWGAMASYRYVLGKGKSLTGSVNVLNAFDQSIVGVNGIAPTGREVRAAISLSF